MKVFSVVVGEVQGVGFRAYVARLAQELNLAGLAKNEYGGSVQIFLDGSEKNIDKFFEIIKATKQGRFGIRVEQVKVFREDEKGFQPPWRKYIGFEIDH